MTESNKAKKKSGDAGKGTEKNGGNKMNTWTKKIVSGIAVLGLAVVGLMLGSAVKVHAYSDSISTNDATAIVVRVTPRADRGVQLSTGNAGFLQLGTVDLGASTQTVNPATVTITGNFAQTELDLSGLISGGWVFENTQTLSNSTGAANRLNAFVSFTSISSGTAPSQNDEYFRVGTTSGSKLTSDTHIFAGVRAGVTVGNGSLGTGRFENNGTGNEDMDDLSNTAQRHMWTYFKLPAATSSTGEQSIFLTLTIADSSTY